MKRPIGECPRYEKSELKDGEGREVADCSICDFGKNHGRACALIAHPKLRIQAEKRGIIPPDKRKG